MIPMHSHGGHEDLGTFWSSYCIATCIAHESGHQGWANNPTAGSKLGLLNMWFIKLNAWAPKIMIYVPLQSSQKVRPKKLSV